MTEQGDSSGADDQRAWLLQRIAEAVDPKELRSLDAHLLTRSEPWARGLRFSIGARAAKMRGPATPLLLSTYGLPAPNGDWLYRYRLDDAGFATLEAALRERGGLVALEHNWWPALFVLWASAWFRRRYRGGGHRWSDLAAALGVAEDQTRFRALTQRGLIQWRRDVIRADSGGREFLSSLAREGGFPTNAILGGGWAADVLGSIIAPLLADTFPDEQRAYTVALGQKERLPQVFRDDDFVQLCGDLAFAIVTLRREADAAATRSGLPVAAWLDLHRPDWRDELPLSTDDAAARGLVSMLLQVTADPASGRAVGVDRLLQRVDGRWREALRLSLDGVLGDDGSSGLDPALGRLRAHAAGELARWVPGELSLIEPPVEGARAWTMRAFSRSRGVHAAPLTTAVLLDLRAGERRAAQLTVTGGSPRRGRMLVMSQEAPDLLKIEGTGSGKYRAETLVVQAPVDWQVGATVGETVVGLGAGVGLTQLWQVTGGAHVTSSDGDCYRLRAGQTSDRRDRITLMGDRPTWARVSGDVDLFDGPPLISLSERGRGGVFWRTIGTREWLPAPGALPVGQYEIAWREDRVLLDKRRIAVLPRGANLACHGRGELGRFTLSGWTGATLTPATDAPVRVVTSDSWQARPAAVPAHRFDATITWSGQPDLTVQIDFPLQAGLARWSGESLPPRTSITLADLRNIIAYDTGHMQLFAELVEPRGRRSASMAWEFDEEMPMSVPAADIASLLLPASIDAHVRLGMHDGIEAYWYLRQFGTELTIDGGGLVAATGIVAPGVELVGRSLADPAREIRFGSYSLIEDNNHRPMRMPEELTGTWLVYLRDGDTVLSRPKLQRGASSLAAPPTALTRAMMLAPRQGLEEALSEVLAHAAGDGVEAAAIIGELIALVVSLRGLPPQTFHVLEALPAHPVVLARMAMLSDDATRGLVLALSDSLPFAWVCLPRACWDAARAARFESNLALVSALPDATRYAVEMLAGTVAGIVDREPLLGPVLLPTRAAVPLTEIAQSFLRRSVDQLRDQGSMFRDVLSDALPRYFLHLPPAALETLDAPCAAALAAAGQWHPDRVHIRRIKAVARAHPTYFAAAFAAILLELN